FVYDLKLPVNQAVFLLAPIYAFISSGTRAAVVMIAFLGHPRKKVLFFFGQWPSQFCFKKLFKFLFFHADSPFFVVMVYLYDQDGCRRRQSEQKVKKLANAG
ncbi:hypothetical protein, partial [Shouchella clausii]|uniref:hypothetical protein n=1 Tax=Shouchella clausii TaxID=79880 RepID=UPI001C52AE1B